MAMKMDGALQRHDSAAHRLLESMDGVAYIVDLDGTILDVGGRSWEEFARNNGAESLSGSSIVGRSLFSMISGSEVLRTQRLLHDRVCIGGKNEIVYKFRCDAPDAERHMRMSISAIFNEDRVNAVLYQSQILAETFRLPVPLFSTDLSHAKIGGYRADQIVTLCSYCHDVAWPVGGPEDERTWISVYDYYKRGGPTDIVVSHGVCLPCFERVVGPDLVV